VPRQTLPKSSAPGPYPTAALALTLTAADPANGSQFALTGRELIIIQNGGGSPRTYTISSVPDAYGRAGDITAASIAAGAILVLGPLTLSGWQQADGNLYLSANHADVKIGIIQLA
jgi:hypothetical protein